MNSRRKGKLFKPRKKTTVSLMAVTAAAVLIVGIIPRALHGHGHWNQIARGAYHAVKGSQVQAAEMPAERADGPLVIYDDRPGDGWQDWSWGTRDLNYAASVHSGKAAIFLKPAGNRGIYLHHDVYGTGGYGTLQAFVQGDTTARVCLVGSDLKFLPYAALPHYLRPDPTGHPGWHLVRISLTDLGVPPGGLAITGIVFQPPVEAKQPLVVDDVSLLPDLSLSPAPASATVALIVNAAAGRHPISPFIYGLAFAPDDTLTDLRVPVNRWGGNDKTRYNWVQGNADNAARDWYFRNRYAKDGSISPGPSSAADQFVRANKAGGAGTLLTVPTIGWVAKDSDNSHASVNVANNGAAGLHGPDGPIAGYDPSANRILTSVRSLPRKNAPFTDLPSLAGGVIYQDEWVAHLKKTFGDASHGGVQFLAMDNEPDLWDSTHTDVHPARMGYDGILHNFLDYATAVKAVDPDVMVTGPVSWGWTGYVYSSLDRGDDNFARHADTTAHGGGMFLPWFLKNVHAHDVKTGRRSLDILDVHFYPQGSGIFAGQTDKATQALRLRSTRSLWDPTYKDESWIGTQLYVIPRLNGWIAANYPGTHLGITEWNWGADGQINGGLAIADVLGIYGRENLYLANYWASPGKNGPGYLAFKLYRNADGAGHGFGDISCAAVSANQDKLSCYAATDSRTGDLTVMLINKMAKATVTAPLELRGFLPAGTVKMWRCAADNPNEIAAFPAVALKNALTLPPQSMTLLRLPAK